MSLKQELLGFGKNLIPVELPELPALNGKIFVRSLTTGERLILDEIRSSGRPLGDHEFVFLGTCDAEGNRLFDGNEVKELDGRLAGRLALAVVKASGLREEDRVAAEKKLEAAQS